MTFGVGYGRQRQTNLDKSAKGDKGKIVPKTDFAWRRKSRKQESCLREILAVFPLTYIASGMGRDTMEK